MFNRSSSKSVLLLSELFFSSCYSYSSIFLLFSVQIVFFPPFRFCTCMLLHQVRRLNRMNHVLLNCHVTPKSKTPSISVDDSINDTLSVVHVRVSAPPDKGKANKAVLKSLADKLGVKPSKLSIQSGTTSRSKMVLLETDADLSTILAQIR